MNISEVAERFIHPEFSIKSYLGQGVTFLSLKQEIQCVFGVGITVNAALIALSLLRDFH